MPTKWLVTIFCLTPLIACLLAFIVCIAPLILVFALFSAYWEYRKKSGKSKTVDLTKNYKAAYDKLYPENSHPGGGGSGFMAIIDKLRKS